MTDTLQALTSSILGEINDAKTLDALEQIRVRALGKKGTLVGVMQTLRTLSPEERPVFGQAVNNAKEDLEKAIREKKDMLEKEKLMKNLEDGRIDVTLPGVRFAKGTVHPLTQVIEDLEDFFVGLGYEIEDGPELENDHYNFEMMNLSKDHPARAMQDSFYTDETMLLRTHTSPVQARAMLKRKGQPLRIICPGKVYRRDDDDPTHSHQFMQIEGLLIDQGVSMASLRDVLKQMARHLFGEDRDIRLRPSYFPFTEPSVEVDVSYVKKDGTTGYIEILGAGMVHPNVLKMGGYDPDVYRGFAFGVGVERIAILKYGIDDIRHFYTNDLRFLNQFKGVE
ncbi:MAG: phenylalanine--tRNA ligase subunit alpha [Acholeplasmataceae bacterium]|nr:phenylalanine--tRNA ligase subunit alpha [Acholeplasmataceae bacterium]